MFTGIEKTGIRMKTATRVAVAAAAGVLSLGMLAGPALAKGAAVGGGGAQYFLNDGFTGTANTVFAYGDPGDDVYVGDWDGNRTDTLMIRRGNTFFVRNSNASGPADSVFMYGDPGDIVLVGDWDGDGTDTLAVRRGNTFYVKNSTTTGVADNVFSYGDRGDVVLVGDWDGNRSDTLVVRRGGQYFVKNDLNTGVAERAFYYGDPGDAVLVGHWSGDQVGDSLGVRRGGTYYLRNSLTSGPADTVFGYVDPTDTAFVGDWNGDGSDTLGVRRPPAVPAPTRGFGDGTYRIGTDMPAGTYRSSANPGASCYWERKSGFGGSLDEIIDNGLYSPEIVTISPSDAGFSTRGCGTWNPVATTYPAVPQSSFGDGTFEVNRHIAPGTYRATGVADRSCYWARLSDFSGGLDGIITNDIDTLVVTISPSDAGFTSSNCGTWTR
jgi:hypothetical protein